MSSDGTTARTADDQRQSVDDVSVPSQEPKRAIHWCTTVCMARRSRVNQSLTISSTRGDLAVPTTRTVNYGPRSFAVVGTST